MTTTTAAEPGGQHRRPSAQSVEEDLERLLRLPAEAREVADAAGGGAAGRGHPARRRRRVHRQLQAGRPSTLGTARSTGWPSPETSWPAWPNSPKVVVGDPLAAGIVAKPFYTFLQILQGSGDPIFSALGLIFADRRGPRHRQERRRLRAGRDGRLPGDERHHGRRRRGAGHQDRDGPGPADAQHRRVRRHPGRHHRRVRVQPVLPDQAAAVPGLLRRQTVRPDRHRVRRHRARRRAGLPLAADRQLHREHRPTR